jgi:hypothetical protein
VTRPAAERKAGGERSAAGLPCRFRRDPENRGGAIGGVGQRLPRRFTCRESTDSPRCKLRELVTRCHALTMLDTSPERGKMPALKVPRPPGQTVNTDNPMRGNTARRPGDLRAVPSVDPGSGGARAAKAALTRLSSELPGLLAFSLRVSGCSAGPARRQAAFRP